MIAKSRARCFHLTNLPLEKGLLQNASKFYYKMRQLFYYKTRQKCVTKRGSFFIIKCVDVITKRGRYYKMRQLNYKTRQVLQNGSIITKCGITYLAKLTKNSYRKNLLFLGLEETWMDLRRI